MSIYVNLKTKSDMTNFVFGPFVMVEDQAECYLHYYIDTVPIVELQFKMAYMVS